MTNLAAAERAALALSRDLDLAAARRVEAETKVQVAMAGVVGLARAAVRADMEAAQRRVAAFEQVLRRSDAWAALTERLLADPRADLSIDVSAEPVPEIAPGPPPMMMTEITIVDTGERITIAEQHRREKARRIAEAQEPPGIREERAAMASRRGPWIKAWD